MNAKNQHFVTCGQMKILEKRADADGLSYYQMMENAGTKAAETILEKTGDKAGDVYIFCGKGNNGGDGFVAARLLCGKGCDVTVVLSDGVPKTEDASANFDLLKDMPVAISDMTRNSRALMELKKTPDIIVDAMYGTGFHGELQGGGKKAAMFINSFSDSDRVRDKKTTVFALDIPSGLGGDMVDEDKADISSVKADYTITFHAKKPIHLQDFAAKYCGETIVADIGIDEDRLWNAAADD